MLQIDPLLPAGACDCHAHVFVPSRFPYAERRAYTPGTAEVTQLQALHRSLAIDRVVLVQPSVYGTDNACMLEALRVLGAGQGRGIAVVDLERATDAQLGALHAGGVRGARLNLHVSGGSLDAAKRQVASAARLRTLPGWCLQVHAGLDVLVSLLDDFRRLDLPVVLDHYAGGLQPDPASEELLARLLAELRHGHLYVKLSAPYRLWTGVKDHAARLAREFHAAAPDRILWGSDWPHTGGSGQRGGAGPEAIEPFRSIRNDEVLRELLACLPDDDARHRLLVRNPARLYGFTA